LNGLDYGHAMWNPEADIGDVEEWERTQLGFIYLGREGSGPTQPATERGEVVAVTPTSLSSMAAGTWIFELHVAS